MFDAIAIARLANMEDGDENGNLTNGQGKQDKSNSKARIYIKRLCELLSIPGSNTRSMFIFSEENFIRRYARMIIEWGYPF